MGIILSGTGVGGLVWAPALKACIDAMGYRNTLRLTGAVSFVLNTGAGAAMTWEPSRKAQNEIERTAQQATQRRRNMLAVPLVDLKLMKSRKFIAQASGAVFQGAAYYIPVFFFATYASTLGYSDTAGANFIALSNACNAIGKIVIGYAADRYGRLNVLLLTTIISAVSALVFWVPSTLLPFASHQEASRGLFIAFTIFYGVFASAYVALFPTSLVELFGPQNFASVNGFLYMLRGLATMVGTPVSGLLIRSSTTAAVMTPRMYEGMSVLVTMLLFATAFSSVWVRLEAMVGPDGRANWKWKL